MKWDMAVAVVVVGINLNTVQVAVINKGTWDQQEECLLNLDHLQICQGLWAIIHHDVKLKVFRLNKTHPRLSIS
jgi:hypothetical protein